MPAAPRKKRLRVHIKNNRASPDTFPNTKEGERVFSITRERFAAMAKRYPKLARQLDITIDWDTDSFDRHMKMADVLIAWDLPTADLARKAPSLKWIHCIGAALSI